MVRLVPRQATDRGLTGATKPVRKPGSGCGDHANDDVKFFRWFGSTETISIRRMYLSAHPGRRDTAEREPYVPTEDQAQRKEEGSEGAAIAGDPGGCCRYRYWRDADPRRGGTGAR